MFAPPEADPAGIDPEVALRVSPHWLRHAIDNGANVPQVRSTLGHGNVATTSGYLHARPGLVELGPPRCAAKHLRPHDWLRRAVAAHLLGQAADCVDDAWKMVVRA